MDRNVKIAKELVKLAKLMVSHDKLETSHIIDGTVPDAFDIGIGVRAVRYLLDLIGEGGNRFIEHSGGIYRFYTQNFGRSTTESINNCTLDGVTCHYNTNDNTATLILREPALSIFKKIFPRLDMPDFNKDKKESSNS